MHDPSLFMKNLLSNVSKNKKGVMKLDEASGPGGSYTTITTWLKEKANATCMAPSCQVVILSLALIMTM